MRTSCRMLRSLLRAMSPTRDRMSVPADSECRSDFDRAAATGCVAAEPGRGHRSDRYAEADTRRLATDRFFRTRSTRPSLPSFDLNGHPIVCLRAQLANSAYAPKFAHAVTVQAEFASCGPCNQVSCPLGSELELGRILKCRSSD